MDRQVILQKPKHKFECDNHKTKCTYFVEVSIINNKATIVALEQTSYIVGTNKVKNTLGHEQKALIYVLWKKQLLLLILHFYNEIKSRIVSQN